MWITGLAKKKSSEANTSQNNLAGNALEKGIKTNHDEMQCNITVS